MEVRSTLEREKERMLNNVKERRAAGLNEADDARAALVGNLIRKIPTFEQSFQRVIKTVRVIQPSIGEEDCRIATCMILTHCSDIVDKLLKSNLIKIVKEA